MAKKNQLINPVFKIKSGSKIKTVARFFNWPAILALAAIGLFVALKISYLSFRFGDGNAYFYMAKSVLEGRLPYRDFLLADPPLLVILLALVRWIIGENWPLMQSFPFILEGATAVILWRYLQRRKFPYAFLAPIIYLGSFLILSTSDYLTGLHFIQLLVMLALTQDEKPILSGILWGLAASIKLYVLPGLLGWLIAKFVAENYFTDSRRSSLDNTKSRQPQLMRQIFASQSFRIGLGTAGTLLLLLIPFLLISPQSVVDQLLIHQLNRPPGLNKAVVLNFFLSHDLALILLAVSSIIWQIWLFLSWVLSLLKQQQISPTKIKICSNWIMPPIFWILFFIIFPDLYYLYLGILAPWLVLNLYQLYPLVSRALAIKKHHSLDPELPKQLVLIGLVLVLLASVVSINHYALQTFHQGKFPHINQVTEFIQQQPNSLPLYGSHEITPLAALLSHRSVFNNYIDTNTQLFASRVLDREKISQQAVKQGVLLISKTSADNRFSSYSKDPQLQARLNKASQPQVNGFFDPQLFKQHCQPLTVIKNPTKQLGHDVAIHFCHLDNSIEDTQSL